MNRAIYILFLFLLFQSHAQNLIPNHSFEDTLACPTSISVALITYATGWVNPTQASPDLFHTCASTPWPSTTGVPDNHGGNQTPQEGKGYCGLVIKSSETVPEYREYIQTQLLNPLIPGTQYQLSMYVSLSEKSNYGTDAFAALFSTLPITRNDQYRFTQNPQAVNPSNNFITDKLEWTQLTFNFIADSAYQYITIGNFQNDTNTMFVPVSGGSTWAGWDSGFYYVDNISLSTYVGIDALKTEDKVVTKIFDQLGRETESKPNTVLIYVYSDGTTEKVYRFE